MQASGPGERPPAAWPARRAAELRLLAPEHPFLRHGRWREFGARGDGDGWARIVASVDERQQAAAGPVGCLGFPSLTSGFGGGGRTTCAHPVSPAARRVLAAAEDWLRDQGAAVVRAPVQFSTWYGHRVVIGGFPDEGGLPPFPLESPTDRDLLALLESSGFTPVHHAVSCLVDSQSVVDQAAPALDRLGSGGVRDRPIRLDDLDVELALLHRLSREIFHGSWGLSEIDLEEFASIYRPLAAAADPVLVRVLEAPDGRAIGFALALGQPTGLGPGTAASVFVLKTIGVTDAARRRHPGLGAALAAMVHRVAIECGYTAGIHALMARGSVAHRLSLRWGREFRQYATFERRLS